MSLRLFDSTVLIAHLKGVPEANEMVADALETGEALASVLSRVEIEGGMRSGESRPVARLMGALEMIPVSEAIAARAGEHLRQFRRSHLGIHVVDYVIAATSEATGADILTLNVKHFPMFPDLRPAF